MSKVLYDAIFKRKSVRKYSQQKLPEKYLSKIENMIKNIEPLKDDIDLKIYFIKDGKEVQNIMRGLIGNFGKIIAPHYLVVTSETKDGYLTNAGYILEKVVLELTSMGIANCWLGGHVKDEDVQNLLNLPTTQKSVVLIAVGYPENKDKEKAFRRDVSEFKRKDLSYIVIGFIDNKWSKILEAARLAPSAGNTQPWRFVIDSNQIHVYCAEAKNLMLKKMFSKINKLDVGIALCHIKIAAEYFGKKIKFIDKHLQSKDKMIYITSIEED